MATVLVVTSAPPLVEGGHLVIARALTRALVAAGHRAEVVLTPSNRFGRQASAYAANWLTDVGLTGAGDPLQSYEAWVARPWPCRRNTARYADWKSSPLIGGSHGI